jgi:hypothetical protein
VSKRADSLYQPGRRTRNWIKSPHRHRRALLCAGFYNDLTGVAPQRDSATRISTLRCPSPRYRQTSAPASPPAGYQPPAQRACRGTARPAVEPTADQPSSVPAFRRRSLNVVMPREYLSGCLSTEFTLPAGVAIGAAPPLTPTHRTRSPPRAPTHAASPATFSAADTRHPRSTVPRYRPV